MLYAPLHFGYLIFLLLKFRRRSKARQGTACTYYLFSYVLLRSSLFGLHLVSSRPFGPRNTQGAVCADLSLVETKGRSLEEMAELFGINEVDVKDEEERGTVTQGNIERPLFTDC